MNRKNMRDNLRHYTGVLLTLVLPVFVHAYSGGTGTEADPYQIANKADLLYLGANTVDYSKHFIMTADINLAGEVFDRAVIAPDTGLGVSEFEGVAFSGVFDGGGHVVSNLTIQTNGESNGFLGLFGSVSGADAKIKKMGLENIYIVGGVSSRRVGGVCGSAAYCLLSECYATGVISNLASNVGGICGYNQRSTICDCYFPAGSISGGSNIGGICGNNDYGKIDNCYMAGRVSANLFLVDGLCGYNAYGTSSNCYYYFWSGPNSFFGKSLMAEDLLEMESFTGFDFVGSDSDGTNNIWALTIGKMPRLKWQRDRGYSPPAFAAPSTLLIGEGTPESPFAINDLDDFHEFRTNMNLCCGCYVLNTNLDLGHMTFVASVIDRHFGGYFDGNGKTIQNIYLNVEGKNVVCIGLFSVMSAEIINLNVKNIVISPMHPTSVNHVGGLCGYIYYGQVSYCSVSGEIHGDDIVGGLCGMFVNGRIKASLFSGVVEGNIGVGGFCGYNFGDICACYSSGDVRSYYWEAGGFCGINHLHVIKNCYSAGTINNNYGGFCGSNYEGVIINCFWDRELSRTSMSEGGTGKTTDQMKSRDIYLAAGWDFAGESENGTNDYWYMHGYPKLTFNASDPYEVNNQMESAYTGLEKGVQLYSISGFGVQSDNDWYRLELLAETHLRVQINCTFENEFGNIDLALCDSDGLVLINSASVTDDEFIDFVVPAPGLYYIKVYGDDNCNLYDLVWCKWRHATPIVQVTFDSGLHGAIQSPNSSNLFVFSVSVGDPITEVPVVVSDAGWFFAGWEPKLPEIVAGGFTAKAYYTNRLEYLRIIGPAVVYEHETVSYECEAVYSDGSTRLVTSEVVWEQNNPNFHISENGFLTVGFRPIYSLRIFAVYNDNGSNKSASVRVDYQSMPWSYFPFYEDFESGLGGFFLSGDGSHWRFNSGYTPTPGTGPSAASEGSGYVYVKAGNPTQAGENFSMKIKLSLKSAKNPVLRFDYHMFGSTMGTLYVDLNIAGVWHNALWSISGAQQISELDAWKQACVDLFPYIECKSLIIRFRGVTGAAFFSDIAVDNVKISDVFSGGFGTESAPYLLEHEQDFFDLIDDSSLYNCHYTLLNDINLAGQFFSNAVIAADCSLYKFRYQGTPFTGVFDGDGHVIRNLTINTADVYADYLGLFGFLKGTNSCVKNISLRNASVIGGASSDFVGILCGYAESGIISKVRADGHVQGRDYIGGLVGYNSADIAKCCSEVNIIADNHIGGLIGWNAYGYIADSYAQGLVTGNSNVGGLVGRDHLGTFSDCYAAATLSSITSIGGFCGYSYHGLFDGCFWDEELTGMNVSSGGVSKTTAEMHTESTFIDAGWDFTNIWFMVDYPTLRCFIESGTYDYWLMNAGIPASLRSQNDTPAGDSIPNLLKYACGLPAMDAYTTADLMTIELADSNTFSVFYYKSKTIVDVILQPIWADSLYGPWSAVGIVAEMIGEDADREQWRASIPVAESGFIRLRATAE